MTRTRALALVGVALLAIGFAPLPIGGRFAARAIHAQLVEQTGLAALAEPADVRITLLPFPKAHVANLRIVDENGLPLARIGGVDAYVRLLDLVGGRLRFTGYALDNPAVDAASGAARDAWRRAGAKLMERAALDLAPPLGRLAISNGRAATGAEPLTAVNGSVVWQGAGSSASAWLHWRWKGERVEARLSDLRLDALAGGRGVSPARLMVTSPFATIEADGGVGADLAPRGDADVRVGIVSASALSRWLGVTVPLAGLVERYTLQGRGDLSPRGFAAAAMSLTIGGSRFDGTLALRLDAERPQLSGTLATQAFDFAALGGGLDAVQDQSGPWSSDAFDPAPLRSADVDMRLSAGRVQFLGARLDDAAISVILNAGRLEVALGPAQAYQGIVRGRATINSLDGARVEARLQASFDNIDVGTAMQDIGGARPMSGRGQGQIHLEAVGASPAELAQRLSGKIATQLREGDINGVSLADSTRAPDRNGGAVALGRGRTPFTLLDVTATLSQGVADIQDAILSHGPFQARASGEVSIRDQSVRLDGQARAPAPALDVAPFSLRGPWRSPEIRFDPAQAFKRS